MVTTTYTQEKVSPVEFVETLGQFLFREGRLENLSRKRERKTYSF